MDNLFNHARAHILGDPKLRDVYYQEHQRLAADRRERDALERAAEDEHQRRALVEARRKEHERLLRLSPAEAWMSQHEEAIDADNCPTRGALRDLVRRERLRLKAARVRLKEMGIK